MIYKKEKKSESAMCNTYDETLGRPSWWKAAVVPDMLWCILRIPAWCEKEVTDVCVHGLVITTGGGGDGGGGTTYYMFCMDHHTYNKVGCLKNKTQNLIQQTKLIKRL